MYSRAAGRTLAALGAVMAGLIAVCLHHRGGLSVDHWVAARLTPVSAWSATNWLHHATDPWYVLMVVWVLALRHEMHGHRRRALALVVPVVAALVLTELVLKPGVDARAASGAWTFPSGNVTGGVALLTSVYWVEVRRRGPWRRVTALAALAVVVALSCLVIVATRTHFLTDTLGGVCVGIGVPLALLARRRTGRAAPVAAGAAAGLRGHPGGDEKA